MNQREVFRMVNLIQQNNINNVTSSDKEIEGRLNLICNFVVRLRDDYKSELELLEKCNVRFCDYYSMGLHHHDDIIKYFMDNYNGRDKDKLTDVFVIYVILKNVQEIVYNYNLCDSPEELYTLLDVNNYFEDLLYMINYLYEKKIVVSDDNLPGFLNEKNKYKILFSGLTFDDIKKLNRHVIKAFINKISGQLSNSDYIILSECVDHVKDLYGIPISRVQFADDYRIVYIRKDDVTMILGVCLKSGKDKDYSRYDSVAKKISNIYLEADMLKNGLLSEDSQHYKVLKILLDSYEKDKNGCKNKKTK